MEDAGGQSNQKFFEVPECLLWARGLDLKGLRARWQSVLQRPAPDHLFPASAVCNHRLSDSSRSLRGPRHETSQLLDRAGAKESGAAMSASYLQSGTKFAFCEDWMVGYKRGVRHGRLNTYAG